MNEDAKREIINLFYSKVKGKKPDTSKMNNKHAGRNGYWLEEQFGVAHNGLNEPDFKGFELKNETNSKTSFGDWSANYYIFNDPEYKSIFIGTKKKERRDKFLEIFGNPNPEKGERYSWSGKSCPRINEFNENGQKMIVNDELNVDIYYSYENDTRHNKQESIPNDFKTELILLVRWYGKALPENIKNQKCLRDRVEDKFNVNGWFTCKTDQSSNYVKLCFGRALDFNSWINLVKEGSIIFDSGMHQGNSRNYSLWRAANSFWNTLIYEEYE